jgi:hypothetical protein
VLVAHACNPSYWEDHGSKPAREIVLETLSWKTLHKNRSGGVAQGEGSEIKAQYLKKKKNMELSHVPVISLLGTHLKELKTGAQAYLFINGPSSIIYKSQE